MSERDPLLTRWLRLKQQSKTSGRALTPADLSKLPSVDSLTSESDLSAFLQPGVPESLLRAALQRAWRVDSEIRDFVGIAESQWDFNDPTAMPGFGPLEAIEESQTVVRLSSLSPGDFSEVPPDSPQEVNPPRDGQPDGVWASGGQPRKSDEPLKPEVLPSRLDSGSRASDGPRRHGSALPKLS